MHSNYSMHYQRYFEEHMERKLTKLYSFKIL